MNTTGWFAITIGVVLAIATAILVVFSLVKNRRPDTPVQGAASRPSLSHRASIQAATALVVAAVLGLGGYTVSYQLTGPDEDPTTETPSSLGGGGTTGQTVTPDPTQLPETVEMPDLLGLSAAEAVAELYELGFQQVDAYPGFYFYVPEPEHCEVMQQAPGPGEQVTLAGQVLINYHTRSDDNTDCT